MKKILNSTLVFIFVLQLQSFGIKHVYSPLISGSYRDIAVKDNKAYMANEWGILIYNVEDKENPDLINSMYYPTTVIGAININGDYLVTGENKTFIYDITQLSSPILVQEIEVGYIYSEIVGNNLFLNTKRVSDEGDLLYTKGTGIYIFDISNIDDIKCIDSYLTTCFGNSICVNGEYIYEATEDAVNIYDTTTMLDFPEQYSPIIEKRGLISCFPNPVNDKSTIEFIVSKKFANRNITISIYNSKGQIVHTAMEKRKFEFGKHSMEWNAQEIGQLGLYFIVMYAGNRSIGSCKVLIIN